MIGFLMPQWFYYGDIVFELFFAIITLFVSAYAFKLYSLSEQRQFKLFALAFLSISLSYIIQVILLVITLLGVNAPLCSMVGITNTEVLGVIGNYLFMLFFITGLIILAYLTFNIKSHKVFLLMFIMTIVLLLLSLNRIFAFYSLFLVLLLFIVWYYFRAYCEKKKTPLLLFLISMTCLLFSSVFYMLAVIKGVGIYYILSHFTELMIYMVAAHIFELAAYLLILINLVNILQNGQKKR